MPVTAVGPVAAVRAGLTAWADYWEGRVPVSRYAPIRVGLGILLVAQFVTMLPVAGLQFDATGLSAKWVGSSWGHVRYPFLDAITGWQVTAVIGSGAVASALFAAGVLPRVSGLVAFALEVLLLHRSNYWQDGSDCLVRCLVFFACFARLSGKGDTGIWPLRFLRLQVAVVYLATAVWKEQGRDWPTGAALYWVLQDPKYQRVSLDWLLATQAGQWLATLGTWGTLWLEFALPVLLLVPRGRKAGLALGTALHLGIWATMRIGLFSPLMLISYLAFVERDEAGRWRVSMD